MAKKLNILFVCTGNTCRSVMAKGLFKKRWSELFAKNADVAVFSAGIGAFEGMAASKEALTILREEGMNLSDHRSSKVTGELVGKADYIFVMTRRHKDVLLSLYPEAGKKIWILLEFAGKKGAELSDPYGLGMERYRQVAGDIKDALDEVIDRLNNFD